MCGKASRATFVWIAVVVVLIAGVAWVLRNREHDDPQLAVGGSLSPLAIFNAGDCLRWDGADVTPLDPRVVPCDDRHVFEVAGGASVDVATSDFPTTEAWRKAVQPICDPMISRYVSLAPRGRFASNALLPNPETWERGDRYVLCGVSEYAIDGSRKVQDFEGRVSEVDQALIRPPGTCIRPDGYAVACDKSHHLEVVGELDLTNQFPEHPTAAQWLALAQQTSCVELASRYLGRDFQSTEELTSTLAPIPEEAWALGVRRLECSIGRSLGTGRWANVTGSFKDGA